MYDIVQCIVQLFTNTEARHQSPPSIHDNVIVHDCTAAAAGLLLLNVTLPASMHCTFMIVCTLLSLSVPCAACSVVHPFCAWFSPAGTPTLIFIEDPETTVLYIEMYDCLVPQNNSLIFVVSACGFIYCVLCAASTRAVARRNTCRRRQRLGPHSCSALRVLITLRGQSDADWAHSTSQFWIS